MRLATNFILCLATIVCAREWATSTDIESQPLEEDDEVVSTVKDDAVNITYKIVCDDSSQMTTCDAGEGITVVDGGPQTTGISDGLIVVDGDELISSPVTSPHMMTQTFGEEHDTVSTDTTPEPSQTEITMSWSSSSLAVSTHMVSLTTTGSVSDTSSIGSSVGSIQGSMSLMSTQSRASSASTSSSVRSTGAAPLATGEVAMMAGGAAMALLVAVL
ncbi:uncharacterized protein AKAW2_41305S [Aspergillus luchuensis]|uniref:Uncharacterized protein n=2 Tax=Aspergillus kawachii TaxID=1069201 RepID=A0A7R7WAY0_ASPKA|nr:uncharacterized protein AKAW2_41305S [Aspergillus luchuensis]BCR99622.1 hypothetical protein AKAW2_41305S [Aspergillus luchuensis]BCS11915.1 hypothetical protein ALUC_41255S [Aspergillus luchuensis]GAA91374.1 similar to An14g06960 [Aspergillus luchuensis IFO 4308]